MTKAKKLPSCRASALCSLLCDIEDHITLALRSQRKKTIAKTKPKPKATSKTSISNYVKEK